MCQHRKSEFLYFLSVLNTGVSLPYASGDVELCDCRWSMHTVPWVPALGRTTLIAHSAGAWTYVKLNHFLIWGIFTSLETWLFNSKTSCCLCFTRPGAEVQYLGKFAQFGNPHWKFCYLGKLSPIQFCYFLEIIQSLEGESPRRRLSE